MTQRTPQQHQKFNLWSEQVKANAISFISTLPVDDSLVITISPKEQTRSDAQNSLLWHWNGEVKEQTGAKQVGTIHAKTKLLELLPLYLSWGGKYYFQGSIAQDAIDRCQNTQNHDKEDIQAYIADRMLRTKGLGVKRFSEYLNAYEARWSGQVRLTTSDDLYFSAMGERK